MQKLKILTFVSKITGKEGTGLDSQIFEEFYRISKICDLHVITEDVLITESNILKIFQVPKISIPKIRGIFKILSYMSKSIINRKKYDVVYVRTSSPPEILSALWLKIFFKKRFVFLVPGTWMLVGNSFKKIFLKYIFKKALNSADSIVLYSKLIIPEIEELVGTFDKSKVVIIKNAIDPNQFQVSPVSTENKILFVGRIHPLKKIDDILLSLPKVKNEIPNIKLEIVGVVDSPKYFTQLKEIIKQKKCVDNVEFIGPIPHNKIHEYYLTAKVFVLMGKNEGIPRSILEAMASGKVVISAPNSGIPDVIVDNKNGFLINNNDPEKLSSCIINILKNQKLLVSIGSEARKTIENNFTWESFISQIIEEFKKTSN